MDLHGCRSVNCSNYFHAIFAGLATCTNTLKLFIFLYLPGGEKNATLFLNENK